MAASATNNLQQSVQSSISSLLKQRLSSNGDIAQDVYRALRDEAHLLLERQLVCDALDSDPFELVRVSSEKSIEDDEDEDGDGDGDEARDRDDDNDVLDKKKNAEVIARFKDMLRVISCTRTATPEGYSSIQAVVQLENDGRMDKAVKENVRLHFTFLREPQHPKTGEDGSEDVNEVFYADADDYFSDDDANSDDGYQPAKKRKRALEDAAAPLKGSDDTDDEIGGDGEKDDINNSNANNNSNFIPKTVVTYKIDYSVDYGKMEQLLGVDVYALGEHPSPEEAVPMMNDEVDDDEEDNDDTMKIGDNNDMEEPCNKNNPHDNSIIKSSNENEKQSSSDAEFEEIEMSDDNGSSVSKEVSSNNDENEAKGDRFGVFINPENVVAFLDRTNMNFNEQSVFYFLMTFPFYEHEWDITGFLLSALFDDDGDDEEEMGEGENGCCKEDCPGDQPCCLPCA